MPDKPSQHIIDEEGTKIVGRRLHAARYQIYERRPDYHIDYTIAPVARGGAGRNAIGGAEVYVQQKAHRRKRPGKTGMLSEPLAVEHLRFWLDDCRLPVFLILVSVDDERAWYLHVQAYLVELNDDTWRTQKQLSVQVPPGQELEAEQFGQAIAAAHDWIRAYWPGPPQAAIRNRQQQLQGLDPRWAVQTTATEDGERHELRPLEPLSLGVNLQPSDLADTRAQFADHHRRGDPIDVQLDDLSIEGSPMFEEVSGPARLRVDGGALPVEITVSVSALDDNLGPFEPLHLSGDLRAGETEFRCLVSDASGAFTLDVIGPNPPSAGQTTHASPTLACEHWDGLDVMAIDDLPAIATLLYRGDARLSIRVHGRRIAGARLPAPAADSPQATIGRQLTALLKLGWLAQQASSRLHVKRALIEDPELVIMNGEVWYDLLKTGAADLTVNGFEINAEFSRVAIDPEQDELTLEAVEMEAHSDQVFEFHGARFHLPPHRIRIAPLYLTPESRKRLLTHKELHDSTLTLTTDEQTTIGYRRLEPDELEADAPEE